jgi:hypothetical protein
VLTWAIAISLVVLAFFAAMDYMNVRILVHDGLQSRAATVIEGEDPTTLSKVFSKGFLESDELLNSDAYQPYNITDYDYDLDVGFALILPWQKQATLTVTESVTDIEGKLYVASDSGISETPPLWTGAVYTLQVVRYEDNWRIVSMETVELLPTPPPTPTPSPTAEPSPTPTQSADPDAEIIND